MTPIGFAIPAISKKKKMPIQTSLLRNSKPSSEYIEAFDICVLDQ